MEGGRHHMLGAPVLACMHGITLHSRECDNGLLTPSPLAFSKANMNPSPRQARDWCKGEYYLGVKVVACLRTPGRARFSAPPTSKIRGKIS